jgi:hypothetical protein
MVVVIDEKFINCGQTVGIEIWRIKVLFGILVSFTILNMFPMLTELSFDAIAEK